MCVQLWLEQTKPWHVNDKSELCFMFFKKIYTLKNDKTGHLHSCGAKLKATKCILFLEQFCVKFAVYTVFGWKIRTALQKFLAFTDSGARCGRQASQSLLKSSGRATKVLLAQTLSYFERGGVSRWTTLLAKHFLQQASRDISVSKQNSKTCKISI